VIAAILVIVSAPFLSWVFENGDVAWALMALAVVPIIDGLRNPYFVQYEKDLSFGRMAFISFGERFTTAIVATAIAFVIGNYWALVLGQIALSLFRTSMTYVFVAQQPKFDYSRWRSFASIVGWLMASNVVDYINRRSATAFLGAGFDTRFVGQFRMGEDLSMMATQQLAMPFRRVLMSGFSKIGEDRQRLLQAFYKAQGTILCLMLPMGVGLALVASEALLLAVGPQWAEAAIVVQFLAPALALSAAAAGTGAILLSHGDIKQIFWRGVAMFVITTPLLVAGLWWQGAFGLVVARALASIIRSTITLHLITSLLNVSLLAPLVASWRTFAAAACMAGGVIMAQRYLPEAVSLAEVGIVLCVKVFLGATVYASVHMALWLIVGRPDGAEAVILDLVRRRVLRSKR
jgi:PST family polysaccharide transporter